MVHMQVYSTRDLSISGECGSWDMCVSEPPGIGSVADSCSDPLGGAMCSQMAKPLGVWMGTLLLLTVQAQARQQPWPQHPFPSQSKVTNMVR